MVREGDPGEYLLFVSQFQNSINKAPWLAPSGGQTHLKCPFQLCPFLAFWENRHLVPNRDVAGEMDSGKSSLLCMLEAYYFLPFS
jgi:hypothetical protein